MKEGMTVGDLKKALENLDDDLPVMVPDRTGHLDFMNLLDVTEQDLEFEMEQDAPTRRCVTLQEQ